MKVILGLGNPGVEYENTRHNTGILFVNKMSEILKSDYGWRRQYGILVYKTKEITLVKSADYFMNESGNIIRDLKRIMEISPDDFHLVHDDLDIKLGEFKIQKGIGPKLHNGVESVENILKTKDFERIRVGIDNRTLPIPGEEYVLQKFANEEREILNKLFEEICNRLETS